MTVHSTAIVDPKADLADSALIGPFCVVGPDVVLGENVRLINHVNVEGRTRIGDGTVIHPFASIGTPPQDLKFKGEPSELIIGRNNNIREYVTMNPGTEGGGMVTNVGDDCLFMMSSHVAHDCQVGSNCVLANSVALAGHVVLDDFVIVGGLSGVHQWVRVGRHAIIGGMSGVWQDVIPYGMVKGNRSNLSGLNLIGLERRGFPKETIKALRRAYRYLFGPEGTLAERIEDVARDYPDIEPVCEILDFMRGKSSIGLCQPKTAANGG